MGKPSDKNDKTQLLSDSMVLEVKPTPPKPPVEDKNDRSVWKGLVVGADEFAPPPPARSKGGPWLVFVLVALAGLGTAAYFLWPRDAAKVAVLPDSAIAAPADVLPQDAAPIAPIDASPDAAPDDAAIPADAAAPTDTVDAGVRAPAKLPFKAPIKRKTPPPKPGKRPVKRTH